MFAALIAVSPALWPDRRRSWPYMGQSRAAGVGLGAAPSGGRFPSEPQPGRKQSSRPRAQAARRPAIGADRASAARRPAIGADRASAGRRLAIGADRASAGRRLAIGADRASAGRRLAIG